jgi:CHAT domain-containing protein
LQDRFAEQNWRHTQLPASARAQLDELSDRVQSLDERIAIAPDIVERIRLESERTLAIGERSRTEQRLRDRLHNAPSPLHPPTLDEVRGRLGNDTALISVLHSGETWWALVILRNEPAQFIDFRDPDLGRNALAWVRRLRGQPVRAWPLPGNRLILDAVRPQDAVGSYLSADGLAKRLSDHLLLPLKEAVGKARHLVFVGDDELVGVPLQALPLGSGLALDRYEVSYAPSLATYARWQGPSLSDTHSLDLLAIGAVDYQPIPPLATDDPVAIGVQIAEDRPLPFAQAEIDAIAAQFSSARTAKWTGSLANKVALQRASKTNELRRYRYVHFAAHAWAQPDQPESSAIILAGAADDVPTHRALTAAELAGLRMNSELIVLSACDTAAGHFEHGQGLLGLAYAGLAAGNRAALLSLWPIADDTTARFMAHFYAKLRHGVGPVAALAATQREFRQSDDPRLSDPLVWAPFILYGGY